MEYEEIIETDSAETEPETTETVPDETPVETFPEETEMEAAEILPAETTPEESSEESSAEMESLEGEETVVADSSAVVQAINQQTEVIHDGFTGICIGIGLFVGIMFVQGFRLRRV